MAIFSELLRKSIIGDGPFIMQNSNGKKWISYNVNFTARRDECLVMRFVIIGIRWSIIYYIFIVQSSRDRMDYIRSWFSYAFQQTWTHVHVPYMPSPVRLSSVCNARTPYSADWNFRQCFYAIWYLGHPLISTETFTEIAPGEFLCRGGLNAREIAKYSDLGPIEGYRPISRKGCKIGGKLILITN